MDWTLLISGLAIATMLIVIGVAVASKRKTDQRRKDPHAEKSTLAKDKASDGNPADV